MPSSIHELRIKINTSIPDQDGFLELTSDMLVYEPTKGRKVVLNKYPYFEPKANYPRKLIQNLPYYKRLEVFFNKEKFNKVVLQNSKVSGSTKSERLRESEEEMGVDSYDTFVMNANFEFTIQSIFPTGFPSDAYYQSMEYYDNSIRNTLFSLKGSRTSWFSWFLPYRFDSIFSYLKFNNDTYTVARVIWINDVFNHPRYSSIVDTHQYGDKMRQKDIPKMKNMIADYKKRKTNEFKLFLLQIKVYASKFTKDTYEKKDNLDKISDESSRIKADITNAMKEVVDAVGNISYLEKEKEDIKDEDDKYKYYESQLKRNNEIFNNDNNIIDGAITTIENKLLKYFDNLKSLDTNAKYLDNIKNQEFIRSFVKKVTTYKSKIKAIQYKKNNRDYTDDPDKEFIGNYLASEFSDYGNVANALTALDKDVDTLNPHWKDYIEKYKGLDSTVKDKSDDLVDEISKCNTKKNICKYNKVIHRYLNVGLDLAKEKSKHPLLEAHVQMDVIKGQVTENNRYHVFCTFVDHMLGHFVRKQKEKTSNNYITSQKFYLDVQDKIIEYDNMTKKEQKQTQKHTKTQKNPPKVNPKQKGGKSRKRRNRLK